ncbi:MAG: serine/threonine-protein phosphatase [Blautia sp.]|nr:serine/threonine-protein phosphatase [Blautia sp.]
MIYIMTQAGHGRDISEDTVLVGKKLYTNVTDTVEIPDEGFICIADGVGGNNAGEVASSFVLEALTCHRWIDDSSLTDEDSLRDEGSLAYDESWTDDSVMRNRLIDINRRLITMSKKDSKLAHMATTLSGVYIKDKELKVIHVGNTRVYAMQGHYLKQLTSDHTVVNFLRSLGRTEEAEACSKNEITSCFGGGDEKLLSKLHIQSAKTVKTLLLTSDGIHEYVSIDELEDILNLDIPNSEKCIALKEAALDAGSTDDMTAVLVCMRDCE